uniref:Uncharacterized protein n=1 Tax=Nothobranchius furzeri TaxID=105023 RepID=A0A1A8AV55_NOTFU
MSSLHDAIKEIILKTLPSLCEDIQESIISTLENCGAESVEDLKYIQQDDIKDLLPVIQQRKLLEKFKQETDIVTLDLEIISSPSTVSPFSSPSTSSTSSVSLHTSAKQPPHVPCRYDAQNISQSWPETFQVPWEKMPLEIQTAISEGKRPPPDKRRQMIRILADEVQKYEANPTRSQCLTICQKISRQYLDTFADMTPSGKVIAGGYSSLLSQLKTRLENVNRSGKFRRFRSSGPSGMAGVKRGPTDTYGCTRFQPELPPEETDDTVEEKRQRLQSTHSKYGIHGEDRPKVTDLMNTTFSLQRKHINRIPAPSLADLQTSWPYLFTQRGIFSHFELLTDVAILRALELSIEECGNAIVEYFRTKVKTADVQKILAQEATDDLTFLVVQLLMAHFKESPDGLILTTDEFATAADVETSLSLPASPRLILRGNEQKLSGWMVSAEGHVIFEGVLPTFSTGLAAVFVTFYIFNLQYQDEAAKTLEFVQRKKNHIWRPRSGK